MNRDREGVLALAELILRNDKYDPWLEFIDSTAALEALREEITELERALEDGKEEKIFEETGDVLWTVYILLSALRKTLNTDYKTIVDRIEDKMKRRKPYIFENRRVSLNEAKRIWRKVKDEERTLEDSGEKELDI